MDYRRLATAKTPALIIYLLDVSASMTMLIGGRRRIDVVSEALSAALRQMVHYSTKGAAIAPRYRIAMLAYSDEVYDLLDGVRTIDHVARQGLPVLSPMRSTDTAKAFQYVENLLKRELPGLQNSPAPLICHMTDAELTGDDPTEVVKRIMAMGNTDGRVLLENIYISDDILESEPLDPYHWPGILPHTILRNEYARKLFSISSPLPGSYREMMLEAGYQIADKAVMMLPGENAELVKMGFVMSTSTPTGV